MKRYEPSLEWECPPYEEPYAYADMREDSSGYYVLYADARSLQAERDRLRELVNSAESIFQHCEVIEGVCGCGDDMEKHASPMDCGHYPVDHGAYMVGRWLERSHDVRRALEGTKS